jgi:hypothetical protein
MKELIESKVKKLKSKNSCRVYFKLGGVGTCLARTASGKPAFTKLDISEKFVFLYAGNLGYPNDLESIAYCAEKLKNDEIIVLFSRAGVKRKWLERKLTKKICRTLFCSTRVREASKRYF